MNIEKDSWKITAPSYRFDINIEDDLIEEVAHYIWFRKYRAYNRIGAMLFHPLAGLN